MRRCLHSLLVGVLMFSLAIDAARACGHLRQRRWCAPPCHDPVVIMPVPVAWGGCGCGDVAVVVACQAGCEEIACGTPLDCCGTIVTMPTAPAAGGTNARPTPAAQSPAPQVPTPVEVAPVPAAAERAPEPLATVPELAPVAPASATEPEPEPEMPGEETAEAVAPDEAGAAEETLEEPEAPATEPEMEEEPAPVEEEPAGAPEPAPQPEPEPTPEPQPEPQRRNPFEEVDTVDDAAPREAPADADPLDPGADADVVPSPASEEVVPQDEPPMEEAATDAAPVAEPPIDADPPFDAPAAEPAAEPEEPGAEPEAAASSAEPLRRWIDETGSFAVVGRLTDARGDVVEILKADGRSVTVPLVRLSGFDRDYVATAGPRVAAARRPGPRPTDTAKR